MSELPSSRWAAPENLAPNQTAAHLALSGKTDGAFRNIVYVPIHIIWFPFLDRLQKNLWVT